MGRFKTYVTGTFFKSLVVIDVTPYVALQPGFLTEFQMNMFIRQVYHVEHLRGYAHLFLAYSDG